MRTNYINCLIRYENLCYYCCDVLKILLEEMLLIRKSSRGSVYKFQYITRLGTVITFLFTSFLPPKTNLTTFHIQPYPSTITVTRNHRDRTKYRPTLFSSLRLYRRIKQGINILNFPLDVQSFSSLGIAYRNGEYRFYSGIGISVIVDSDVISVSVL